MGAGFACILACALLVAPGSARSENHDSVLAAYVEVWNTGQIDRLDELVAPGFRRHAGPDESIDSRAALAELITQTRSIYDHLKISVDDAVTTDARGAFRGRFYGVHKAVNGVIEFPLMSMVRFESGAIAEEWILGDNFLSLVVLGHELVPPGFEAIPPPAAAAPASARPSGARP